jgi:outer membrane protein assembly factor BamB
MNRRTGTARVLDAANRTRKRASALALGGVRARVGVVLFVAAAAGGGLLAASARADTADLAVAYQINVAHSGVQTASTLTPPFSLRWRTALPGAISYPLIAQGMVFVTAASNSTDPASLYALDQHTGQVVWSQPLPNFIYRWANAAYDAGRIFVVGGTVSCDTCGLMDAFSAETGAPLWNVQLPGQYIFSSPPTAANGVVYTAGAGSGGTLYAVDETTGNVLATQPVENGDNSSPTLSDTGVFVSYACDQTYGFLQTSLAPIWHYSTICEGGGGKTTVYANGRLYTRDSYLGDLILDAGTGNLLGSFSSLVAPAVDQSSMFTLTNPNYPSTTLAAERLSDGATRWTFTGDGQLDTAPIVLSGPGGEFVVEGSGSGMLYALDAATGVLVWSTNVGTAIPQPEEYGMRQPLTGLGAGQGLLVVPADNTISAYGLDSTAPTITVPSTVTARATSNAGAVVSYAVSATDPDDTATVSCSPSSGSTFPIGTTAVQCTATDTVENTTTASFLVVVSAPGADCNLSDYPFAKGALTLKNANLSGCYLPAASLSGANATNANLTGTYLAGANLSSANLSQAQMQRSVLNNTNLSAAKLNLAVLTGATLTGATLTGVTWAQTTCPDGTNSNNNGYTCTGHLG